MRFPFFLFHPHPWSQLSCDDIHQQTQRHSGMYVLLNQPRLRYQPNLNNEQRHALIASHIRSDGKSDSRASTFAQAWRPSKPNNVEIDSQIDI
jgi:hypothetical protein